MFWYGVLPCMAAVIAVGVLTKKGMIPYDIGTPGSHSR